MVLVVEPVVAEAIDGLKLLHTPPAVTSLKVVVPPPEHKVVTPVIAAAPLTVTTVVLKQPVDVAVYVIVAVPGATPVTIPVADPTVAILVLALVHVPAPAASVSGIVDALHKGVLPVIAGAKLTVTAAVVATVEPQPLVTVSV